MKYLHVLPAIATSLALGLGVASSGFASEDDRDYQFGESEGGSNGNLVIQTFDDKGVPGQAQLVDLTADGGSVPSYITIPTRPDGGTGIGVVFSGAEYLRGESLNFPEESVSALSGRAVSDGQGGTITKTLNYDGIANRGMQFWARPGSASGPQTIVMDSNQHGVRINSDGNFSMRYGEVDTASSVSAAPNTWYHIMVVRPDGAGAGSRMYVDGVAVAANNLNNYAVSSANLVIGANTGGDDGTDGGVGFTGGTEEFYTGIIDDMNMFVIGDNSAEAGPPAGMNWGEFDFATENDFAAFTLTGVDGDVDNNGTLQQADVDDFIIGWQTENLVNGVRVGDLNSIASGDLNFDGITDIFDLNIMQEALRNSGLATISAAQLAGVPEPSSLVVLLLAVAGLVANTRRIGR